MASIATSCCASLTVDGAAPFDGRSLHCKSVRRAAVVTAFCALNFVFSNGKALRPRRARKLNLRADADSCLFACCLSTNNQSRNVRAVPIDCAVRRRSDSPESAAVPRIVRSIATFRNLIDVHAHPFLLASQLISRFTATGWP